MVTNPFASVTAFGVLSRTPAPGGINRQNAKTPKAGEGLGLPLIGESYVEASENFSFAVCCQSLKPHP